MTIYRWGGIEIESSLGFNPWRWLLVSDAVSSFKPESLGDKAGICRGLGLELGCGLL